MRPAYLVAASGLALALGGCGDPSTRGENPTGPGPSPTVTGTPSGGSPVPGGVDRASICAGYQKAEADAEAKLLPVLPKAADAMGDPAKSGPVIAELTQVMAAFEAAIAVEAARSADTELKAAIQADLVVLGRAIADIKAAGNDMQKALAALQTEQFEAAGEKVSSLCER